MKRLILSFFVLTTFALATTINVPAGQTTIQAGLSAASAGDTVLVQPGTYTENIIWPETNGIKLISAGDSSNTIIDGGGTSSVIYINPQTATIDTTTLIQGFKITNGGGVANGGGIVLLNSNPKFENLNVINNEASSYGAGIYLYNFDGVIRNISIINNTTSECCSGGGIYIENSNPDISNITAKFNTPGGLMLKNSGGVINGGSISNNTANGGGLYATYSSTTIKNIEINDNINNGSSGAGLWIQNSNGLELINLNIMRNYCNYSEGSGIYVSGLASFNNVNIIGNYTSTSNIKGAGIYIEGSAANNFNNITIASNAGGGIYDYSGSGSNFINTSIVGNGGSGIILRYNSSINLESVSIISNNGGINQLLMNPNEVGIPTFNDVNILDNGSGFINPNNTDVITAENIWWGHSSGPYHPTQNSNGQGDSVDFAVDVDPWLTAPNTDAPPIPAQNVQITSSGYNYVNLSWDASDIGDLSGYKVYYDTDASGYPYASSVDVSNVTTYNLTGLNTGSPYYIAITTYDTDGNESWYSTEAQATPAPDTLNVPVSYTTIQSALTAASEGDVVLVQPGTYTENILWPETNGIKLISAGDSSNTIIDGNEIGRVINILYSSIDTSTVIEGFTLTNGNISSDNGGGIQVLNGGLILTSMNIINNKALNGIGGGLYIDDGTYSVIRNSSIKGNEASASGGANISTDSVKVINCVISSNSHSTSMNWALAGGLSVFGHFFIDSTSFSNNYSYRYNGGGHFNGTGKLQNLTFDNNTSRHLTSAFRVSSSSDDTIRINNVTVTNNSGSNYGSICVDANAIIDNSTITDNSDNGIIISQSGSYGIIKNTIIHNNSGYGIFSGRDHSNSFSLNNCTISNNGSSGIYINDPPYISPSIVNSTIINNDYGIRVVDLNDSYPLLINNSTIINNDYGIYSQVHSIEVENSNFQNNSVNGVYLSSSSGFLTATGNWWGNASGPNHSTQNTSGTGDSVSAYVNVNPWLTAPDTDAPPIPAQNTTVTGTGNDFISLNWEASLIGDLAGYKLYYDSDSSGYPYTNSVDVGTDTSYTLSSLTLGTTYYLAVTTYDTDGNESWYSNEVSGVTRVMQAQSLDIGGDEDLQHMVNHTPSITFGYYDSMNEAQTNYQVQVSTDSTFSSVNMWDAGSVSSDTTSVTYAGTALVDGTTYYLRVRVASSDFWSDWSTLTFRMNTEPTTPVLVSPINNQVSGTPVGLKVLNATDAEGDAITYSFNVYSDVALTTKLDSATAVAEGTDTTSWQITGSLPDNGQYFWTVSTNDGYEESAVSDAGLFLLNTDNNAPEAFTLSMPLVDTEVQNLSPVFSWNPANDPDPIDTVYYKLMLDTPDPGVVVFEVGTDTSFQVTNALMDNTEYFWQVMAEDVIGFQTINEGGYKTFYTNVSNEPPTASTLVAPLNGSIQTDLTPNFYWTEAVDPDPLDHVSYTMNWWPLGVLPYINSINTDSTGVSPDEDIPDNAQFGWMVVANDMYDSQSSSDTSYFYSDAFPEPPLNFATVTPENNVEGLATEVEFIWEETDDPDPVEEISYRVVYASDWEDSSTYVYSETIEDTSMVITLGDNSQYYWLVEAMDSDGFIVGSNNNTSNVIIVGTLAIDGDLIPVEFALRQNYPNPFNPVTTLRYDLPDNALVTITIYDMMGREIKNLVNQTQDAGYKSIIWDATNDYGKPVSAGIYLYQIQAGEYMQTKKMVLLK